MNNEAIIKMKQGELIIQLNSSDISSLMGLWNIVDNRANSDDFDGGIFSGKFDNNLTQLGYVRLCIERKNSLINMIIVNKDHLDSTINQSIITEEHVLKCSKDFREGECEYIEAFETISDSIIASLGLDVLTTGMYCDGLDYVLSKIDERILYEKKDFKNSEN